MNDANLLVSPSPVAFVTASFLVQQRRKASDRAEPSARRYHVPHPKRSSWPRAWRLAYAAPPFDIHADFGAAREGDQREVIGMRDVESNVVTVLGASTGLRRAVYSNVRPAGSTST